MNGMSDPAAKKRLTTLADGTEVNQPAQKKQRLSPPAARASADSDDGDDEDGKPGKDVKLESFRKEAIWREMQEYKRRLNRAQDQVTSLEAERLKCEARLSSVDLSWNLLVQEADLLLPSTSTAANGHSSALSPAVSDPTLSDDDLSAALAQRSQATKTLLGRLSSLHFTGSGSGEKIEELESKCRDLLKESLKSQESLRLLRLTHDSTIAQLDQTHSELLRAEKKLDRFRSSTVAAVEGRPDPAAPPPAPAAQESQEEKPKVDEDGKGAEANGVGGAASAAALVASENMVSELRGSLDGRDRMLEELRADRIKLRTELDVLKGRLASAPEEMVISSAPFRLLQSFVQNITIDNDQRKSDLERVRVEADSLREGMESFRNSLMRDTKEQIDETQRRLNTKESDINRIRTQREEYRAEISELRARDSDKMKASEEVTKLSGSRQERITALESEVKRLKMSLRALKGDKEGVEMLLKGEEEDAVHLLREKLASAEAILLALGEQMQSYDSLTPAGGSISASTLVDSEKAARSELASCRSRLSKLEALLSPSPDGTIDVAQLAKKLEEKEEAVKVFEAKVAAQEGETEMLYGEIERLSNAWSELDGMVGAKVYNLAGMEEKMGRLAAEKAKADNRYFATMRQKDSLTAENAVLTKLAEKQRAAVEGAAELQTSTSQQVTAVEKELTAQQKLVRQYQDSLAAAERKSTDLALRNDQSIKHITELNKLLGERIAQAENELALRKKLEEQVSKQEKELKAAKAAAASSSSSGGGSTSAQVRDLKQYNEDLSKMLKCSTCVQRFKSVVINRCGHLFCKECIDDRIANRQRKCPSCAIQFGRDDVSTVFF